MSYCSWTHSDCRPETWNPSSDLVQDSRPARGCCECFCEAHTNIHSPTHQPTHPNTQKYTHTSSGNNRVIFIEFRTALRSFENLHRKHSHFVIHEVSSVRYRQEGDESSIATYKQRGEKNYGQTDPTGASKHTKQKRTTDRHDRLTARHDRPQKQMRRIRAPYLAPSKIRFLAAIVRTPSCSKVGSSMSAKTSRVHTSSDSRAW